MKAYQNFFTLSFFLKMLKSGKIKIFIVILISKGVKMGFNNTITIISNSEKLVEQISEKLVLLRDLDKVTSSSQKDAVDFLKNQLPNVIMLHCANNDPEALNLIKQLKSEALLSRIPILLLDENCSRETVIDAFDAGVCDILKIPCEDHELLIRVIWCIQKDEINTNRQTQFDFMKDLGIIQPDTGVYTQKYCEEFLKNEVEHTIKHKAHACLMLITPDDKYPGYKNPKEFLDVINKSVRLNDSVAIKDVDEFYVFLPKTKLNGVYPVFERINNNLGVDCGANASVIEIKEERFEAIKNLLQEALNKAKQETNALIVASDIYSKNPNAGINLAKQALVELKEKTTAKKLAQKTDMTPDENKQNKLFRQAYRQKCKIVFEPVFEKYQNHINNKIKDVTVRYDVTVEKTNFVMYKNNTRATLSITYGGLYKARIDTSIVHCDITKNSNSVVLDFVQLNFQRLSQILEELYIEFKNQLKASGSN